MSSSTLKAASSLARYRPAILAFTAIAAGFTIYAIRNNILLSRSSSSDVPEPPTTSLHRSNAQRRRLARRRPIDGDTEVPREAAPELGMSVNYEERYHDNRRVFGLYQYTTYSGTHTVWLAPFRLPSVRRLQTEWNVGLEEASLVRRHMEIKFLDSFFAQEMPPGPPIPLNPLVRDDFYMEFGAMHIQPSDVAHAIGRYEAGDLQDHPARSTQMIDPNEPRPTRLWTSRSAELPPDAPAGDLSAVFQVFRDSAPGDVENDGDHIAETESNQSNEVGDNDEDKPSQNQNLMNLLYRIAEDQAKKENFHHRGINCNSCNAMPIRGIRYRCSNCHDYDLCEQCESLQIHDKTHLFYKIRIPAPFLGNPREPSPVWYPGDPGKASQSLTTESKKTLSTRTGIPDRQVDACWEQFQCLASSDFPDDPHGFCVAMDRRDFNMCFVPSQTQRPPPPNLIYDRMFSFYDYNNDGLIGFEEFLDGLSCIANRGSNLQAKMFRAYDVDSDGFVTRKDFLRMFRAYYAITKELTAQIVSCMDDEFFDEDDARGIIGGSQPISSIFSGAIPPGEQSHSGMGKSMNRNGDMQISDGQGILLQEGAADYADYEINFEIQDKLVADHAEYAQFGSINLHWFCDINPQEVLEVEDHQWPKDWLKVKDIIDALGFGNPLDPVTDHVERSLVLCAGLERAQQEGWDRVFARRRAIDNRWSARRFYLEGETVHRPAWDSTDQRSALDSNPYPDTDIRSLRIRVLDSIKWDIKADWFRQDVVREVKKQWPDYAEPTSIPHTFEMWLRQGRRWHEMAQDLAPTRADTPKAGVVVGVLLQRLVEIERSLRPLRDSEPASPAIPSPVSKRSRSSSKVRFEDEPVGGDDRENRSAISVSSRSIPVGERWGGYDIPLPEVDFGREIIYQVTQEGMNELLDPMFKLREDLAVEVRKTRRERHLHKDEIDGRMRSGLASKIPILFKAYQKMWYQDSRDISNLSQAIHFVECMLRCLKQPEPPDSQNFDSDLNPDHEDKDANVARLQAATDAIVKLDQSVANEVSGEVSAASAGPEQRTSASLTEEATGEALPEYPTVAVELDEGVAAYDGANTSIQDSIKEKPVELLLADAGYGVVTPPVQELESSSASLVSSPEGSVVNDDGESSYDPTLPQHRPNSVDEWEARYRKSRNSTEDYDNTTSQQQLKDGPSALPEPEKILPLSEDRLMTLAIWNVIEEDDRKRGGPGRLDLTDYTWIMEGDKGQGLGFVGSWIETAAI
ncbi:MAG: hypothetical protein Q9166_003761 [cf. Caloplaca sp. 2 TL-2023]